MLLIYSSTCTGQPYFFKHYQVENGLSNNSVYCSVQDQKGFLWFGTKDGLNRFDGYHFKQFTIQEKGKPLAADMISCLTIDNNNTLWVGCRKGLYFFNADKEFLQRFTDSLPEINSMQIDQHNQLWFISRFTVCRYNFKTKVLKIFSPKDYFEGTSICLDEDGTIWIATPNGFLQKFNEVKETFKIFDIFSHSQSAASNWIQKIHPAEKGFLFAGTSSQGLKKINTLTGAYTDLLTFNPDKTTVYVRDIKKYSDNEYWFATESGIFTLNTITQKFTSIHKKFLDPYSLSDNAVYSLCKDAEGGMWAGTYFGGLNYYSKQYSVFQKYFPDNTKNSISGSSVREICADKLGNIWIGTEDEGLNKLNPTTGAITQFKPSGIKNSLAYSNIHGLLVVGENLWIGTFEHGLDVLDIKTGNIIKHYTAGSGKNDLKSNFIVSLLKTSTGKIFVGTGNSLFQFDAQKNGFDPVNEIEQGLFISCMVEDSDKTIWIGTHDKGIYFYNPITKIKGHFENEPGIKNSLTTNTINAICEDRDKNLWFATEGGGLCKLDKNRKDFTGYFINNGLPSNFIFKILEDDKHTLWISTSRGLVNFNPEHEHFINYTKDNGLLNDQFNYNSGYKDETGKMYFGSVKGMITFRPDDLVKSNQNLNVLITGFQVQNKELEIDKDSSILNRSIIYTENITLPYDRSSFSIDFSALSFTAPEMVVYRYLMSGLDKEWTEIKPNRKIYFTNLAPGKYVLKLKATTSNIWGTEEKQLTIIILSPWWSTWLAYTFYAIFILGLAYYLLRSYHIIVQDKKEKEIYEAKLDFFTNIAHEIRTPLTLIKGPVDNLLEQVDELPEIKADVISMEKNTNRLITLINQILDFRKVETKGFSIDFLQVNITALLKDSFLNFYSLAKKRNLEYIIDCPENEVLIWADEEALIKIFSNLLNNAVKYSQSKIVVRLQPITDDEKLIIEFENDGEKIPEEMRSKIFEPFYRLKSSMKHQGTGIGLALAKSLTILHDGDLSLNETDDCRNVFVLSLPIIHREERNKFKRNKSNFK